MEAREPAPLGASDEAHNRRRVFAGFWPKLKRVLPRLPFAADLVAGYYCATDPATPRHAKAILLAALAYFVLPTDLVPDFLAHVGFGDDATVLYAAYRAVSDHIREPHRERARAALARLAG
ncbi:MAG: DUF1232 domain-containing protein [Alphaproteobacteria bacterium]|nr:DUF1232 domain-containing protein [Alphaproteobacteria bacterium]